MGIRAKSNLDRSRTKWTPEMDRYFIDLMLEQNNERITFYDYVFSKTAWMNMNSSFNERFKFEYEMDVLKNRYKVLRNLYKAVKNLLNQKGFNWDSTRQMVIAENKIWDEYIKVNPDVRPYRVKTIPYYDDLGIIYGDNSARKTGSAAQPECGNKGTVEAVHEIGVGDDCISLPQEVEDTTENGNQIDGVFCKEAWTEMIASFNAKFGSNYDVDILKNRYKTLRRQYNVIKNLLQLDGFAWDDDRQMVIADDSVWQEYIKGHKDARQFMTRPMPYYKYLCLICNSYPDESDCFSLQCTEPENGVQEVKPGQATKCSQSPVTSVSSEDEIGAVLEPAHLDSNTTGSNPKCKRQPENRLNSAHTKKSRGEDDGMASALREMASAVSSLTEKKDDGNTNSIPIENVITAVQALPDMDEDLILDACDLLEDEIKAKTFMALDVKLRKKWLLRKLRPQQCV
ncbi:hypothetical protein E1A91_A08G049800v1 [Gossypium mustelinum]|uniref:Myb/SANT-like domain-containing protein n=1 Tax=Gossypium mustelinum TaxID=34275 RepID=A0A5D2Y7Q1_GOSMU|nr:hypothetical protein E1A91_A08G049800v1 [Gossypium mustelinum]